MSYFERIHPSRAGENFTDIIEIYEAGAVPGVDYPVIAIIKLPTFVRRLNGTGVSLAGCQWSVQCDGRFTGKSDHFPTKAEAMAYAGRLLQ